MITLLCDDSGTLLPGRGNGRLVRQNTLRLFREGDPAESVRYI